MLPTVYVAVFLAVCAFPALGLTAPNTSLAGGTPISYFGGNSARRGDANIEMLAKMRMVMLEKWEGSCWTDCLASNNSKPPVAACLPGCHVEQKILDTLERVKKLNPAVCGVMYLVSVLSCLNSLSF